MYSVRHIWNRLSILFTFLEVSEDLAWIGVPNKSVNCLLLDEGNGLSRTDGFGGGFEEEDIL